MLFDIQATPAQLRQLGAWVEVGPSMANVQVCVDDDILSANQGDERIAWNADGSVRSKSIVPDSPQRSLTQIHEVMDGEMWSSDTLDAIAEILHAAGFVIAPPSEDA